MDVAEVIRNAGAGPLAFGALALIVLYNVALAFFARDGLSTRLAVYSSIIIFVAYVITIWGIKSTESEGVSHNHVPADSINQDIGLDLEPDKVVIDNASKNAKTIANWAGRTQSETFYCLATPPDFVRVDIDTVVSEGAERQRRGCLPPSDINKSKPGSYCDSHNEYYDNIFIKQGCFVNQEWHEWYKRQQKKLKKTDLGS
jgi:hypothetical protein